MPLTGRLDLAALPRERWRNGRGWTRPIAARHDGEALRWRVSLAEIDAAAPFSVMPGIDRHTVLVDGGPVTLVAPQARWTLARPGDQASYPGDWPLENEAPVQPALVWNLMLARGHGATLRRLHDATPMPAHGRVLLWVLGGAWSLGPAPGHDGPAPVALGPCQGWIAPPRPGARLQAAPASAGAQALLTIVED